METRVIDSSTGSTLKLDVWSAGDRWALLVHGLSSNAQTWWQVAQRMVEAGTSVVTVDQRSHGRSDVTADGYGWETLSADLIAVLDAVGADRVLAAGQSWGASVVLELANRHPSRVSGVVSVDGGYFALRSRFPTWEACRAALRPADIPPVTRAVMRGYLRDAHPGWSDEGIEATLGNFREIGGLMERALPIPHHMDIVHNLWEHDPRPLYQASTRPSAVIAATPTTDHIEVAADLVIAMPGDHDLHVEQPDRVADFLLERTRQWGV